MNYNEKLNSFEKKVETSASKKTNDISKMGCGGKKQLKFIGLCLR